MDQDGSRSGIARGRSISARKHPKLFWTTHTMCRSKHWAACLFTRSRWRGRLALPARVGKGLSFEAPITSVFFALSPSHLTQDSNSGRGRRVWLSGQPQLRSQRGETSAPRFLSGTHRARCDEQSKHDRLHGRSGGNEKSLGGTANPALATMAGSWDGAGSVLNAARQAKAGICFRVRDDGDFSPPSHTVDRNGRGSSSDSAVCRLVTETRFGRVPAAPLSARRASQPERADRAARRRQRRTTGFEWGKWRTDRLGSRCSTDMMNPIHGTSEIFVRGAWITAQETDVVQLGRGESWVRLEESRAERAFRVSAQLLFCPFRQFCFEFNGVTSGPSVVERGRAAGLHVIIGVRQRSSSRRPCKAMGGFSYVRGGAGPYHAVPVAKNIHKSVRCRETHFFPA